MTGLLGAILSAVAAVLLYAATPHQRLLARRVRGFGYGGGALALAGLVLLLGWAGPATAVFIWLTAGMTVWSVVPLAAAWGRIRRQAR